MQAPGGTSVARRRGPAGISDLALFLANLFMHYVSIGWMDRKFRCPFERHADDVIAHCKTEGQASCWPPLLRLHGRGELLEKMIDTVRTRSGRGT